MIIIYDLGLVVKTGILLDDDVINEPTSVIGSLRIIRVTGHPKPN
jgi:hypothetical protein